MDLIVKLNEYDIYYDNTVYIPVLGGIPGEVWKHIDFEPDLKPYYWVSNYGRIASYIDDQFRIMNPTFNTKGYLQVNIQKIDNSRITRKMHRLVMLAFNPIDNPEDYEVNHKNGIKTNNCLYNLEWIKPIDNTHHAMMNGLKCNTCEYNPNSYLHDYTVEKICELYLKGYCCSEIMELLQLDCKNTIVYNILSRRTRVDITSKFNLPDDTSDRTHRMFSKDQAFYICNYFSQWYPIKCIEEIYIDILNELSLPINNDILEGLNYIINGLLYKKVSAYYDWEIPLIKVGTVLIISNLIEQKVQRLASNSVEPK